jgi:hypothetical protein
VECSTRPNGFDRRVARGGPRHRTRAKQMIPLPVSLDSGTWKVRFLCSPPARLIGWQLMLIGR